MLKHTTSKLGTRESFWNKTKFVSFSMNSLQGKRRPTSDTHGKRSKRVEYRKRFTESNDNPTKRFNRIPPLNAHRLTGKMETSCLAKRKLRINGKKRMLSHSEVTFILCGYFEKPIWTYGIHYYRLRPKYFYKKPHRPFYRNAVVLNLITLWNIIIILCNTYCVHKYCIIICGWDNSDHKEEWNIDLPKPLYYVVVFHSGSHAVHLERYSSCRRFRVD